MQRRSWSTKALVSLAALAALAGLGACGQITGLSDDYTFTDDAGAAVSRAAAGDHAAPGADGAADGAGDSCGRCSPTQQSDAAKVLEQAGATTSSPPPLCQACLQAQCCTELVDCGKASGGSNCKDLLNCVVKCQEKGVGERATCVNGCNAVNLVNALVGCSNQCVGTPCKLR